MKQAFYGALNDMPHIFRVGDRVTHRDNNLMRGFVKSVQGEAVNVLWDNDPYEEHEHSDSVLPVEFGMGTRWVCRSGAIIEILSDAGDIRFFTPVSIINNAKLSPNIESHLVSKIRNYGWREAGAEVKEEWPKIGSQYWCVIGNGTVEVLGWTDDVCDRQYLAIGNVFRDKASAQAAAERVKAALKGV